MGCADRLRLGGNIHGIFRTSRKPSLFCICDKIKGYELFSRKDRQIKPVLKKQAHPALLFLATLVLALLSMAAGIDGAMQRFHLLAGIQTSGVVVGVHVGVRGLKRVEARFMGTHGQPVVGRDLHSSQWFADNKRGDRVALHYDPQEPGQIFIDRGWWGWSNPGLLLGGAVALLILAGYFLRRALSLGH